MLFVEFYVKQTLLNAFLDNEQIWELWGAKSRNYSQLREIMFNICKLYFTQDNKNTKKAKINLLTFGVPDSMFFFSVKWRPNVIKYFYLKCQILEKIYKCNKVSENNKSEWSNQQIR